MAETPGLCCIVNDVDSRDDVTECFNGQMKKKQQLIITPDFCFVVGDVKLEYSL